MNWFNEDPFEDILKEFFGESSKGRNYKEEFLGSEEDERIIDYSEDKKNVFFIFELPGYEEDDLDVSIKEGFIKIKAQKKDLENIPDYLSRKLSKGFLIKKKLPKFINFKKFSKTMKNGILEVVFNKK
jgi:HSP20 family molecular chaperone IbpA